MREKPEFDFLVSTGFYVVEPSVLDDIEDDAFAHMTDVINDYLRSRREGGRLPGTGRLVDRHRRGRGAARDAAAVRRRLGEPVEDIVVIGAGGHAKVVIDALALLDGFESWASSGPRRRSAESVLGVPIIGTDADLNACTPRGSSPPRSRRLRGRRLPLAIGGCRGSAQCRPAAAAHRASGGDRFSPRRPGGGRIRRRRSGRRDPARGSARCAIVNTGPIVDHDCVIGEFAHISPGAALSGG